MKYFTVVLGITTIVLMVGALFLFAGLLGSLALSTWETNVSVRYFTYMGLVMGGLIGLKEAIKYMKEQK